MSKSKFDQLEVGKTYRFKTDSYLNYYVYGEFLGVEVTEKSGRWVCDKPRQVRKARFRVDGIETTFYVGPPRKRDRYYYRAGREVTIPSRLFDPEPFDVAFHAAQAEAHRVEKEKRESATRREAESLVPFVKDLLAGTTRSTCPRAFNTLFDVRTSALFGDEALIHQLMLDERLRDLIKFLSERVEVKK